MSASRLLAVICKELRHITRDSRVLFLVTFAPAFLLVTLSYVFALDVSQINIAVRDLDRTSLSRDFVASLDADDDLTFVAYVEYEEDIERMLVYGTADVVLVIPHGFADAALAGGPAEMHCIVDGSDSITAGQTVSLLQLRVSDFVTSLLKQRSVDVSVGLQIVDRAWYNETLKSLVSMVPGMLAIIMCMPALALTLALTREKETGSFEGLIATPVRKAEYLLGKLLAYVLGGVVSLGLAWLVATQWFHVPFRGSFLDFVLLAVTYLFASMGISMLVANFVRNQQTAMFLVLMVFFIPGFFIAGLIVPVADEPVARAIAYILPTTHFIVISRGVFLKGLNVVDLWRPAGILLITGLFSLLGSLALLKKKVV
jgi:ABC-2 type transport system permease protein